MSYKYLLFDADETLFDFIKDEKNGFYKTLEHFGITPNDSLHHLYSSINLMYWKAYERGDITKDEIGAGRYSTFLNRAFIRGNAEQYDNYYKIMLSQGGNTLPYAHEICERLQNAGYLLYIITNGTDFIQKSRLGNSGLEPFFSKMYVSEVIGYQKPKKEFFDFVLNDIGSLDKNKYLIIGDSLSSDISGGKNTGIDTVWYNSRNEENNTDIIPDYEIKSLIELKNILL